ncbi:hypothetical protein GAY28_16330 [Azospirillum brasilense]|nr:hypothetical protein [Azospirillum brasilense]
MQWLRRVAPGTGGARAVGTGAPRPRGAPGAPPPRAPGPPPPPPPPKNADALSRWIDRCEGMDRTPILAALDAHEKAVAGIEKTRGIAEKALADLQAALVRLDAPETLAHLAKMKLQRDLSRALPVIQEFIEAEAAAASALARMQAAGLRLKALAE